MNLEHTGFKVSRELNTGLDVAYITDHPTLVGRLGWPGVFEYVVDGKTQFLPPEKTETVNGFPSSKPYTIVIHDMVGYEYLRSTGRLYSWPHQPKREPLVDNRMAPGS